MSDTLKPIPFERLLEGCLQDYYTKGKILEINEKDFYKDIDDSLGRTLINEYLRFPIGPAAGPHTQLAQNILAAYLTGSRYFELKTVQTVDGKQMQEMIEKPCIDAKNVGYNVEWSTELTVSDAKDEYIKAFVLLQVMAIELGLSDKKDFIFNISCGYDLKGIQSEKISNFIDDLKDAKDTNTFKDCIEVLKKNIDKFKKFKLEDINKISSKVSNILTLSTMHGCKASEILSIGKHLIQNKKINTFIKLNPTLLGFDGVREVLDGLGYNEIVLRHEDFDNDLQFDMAVETVTELKSLAKENGLLFGVKLTNTLPVYNSRSVLPGESMYLSGKPLYPIAIGVAKKIGEAFNGDLHISLSGGADKNNILDIFNTGIAPITLSTLFLKPRGYANSNALIKELRKAENPSRETLDLEAISALAEKANADPNYQNKGDAKPLENKLGSFDCFKGNCGICVDVCPNRANMRVPVEGFDSPYQIVHLENSCNECGNCHLFCPKGGHPYFKKVTVYDSMEAYKDSSNSGVVRIGENKYLLRDKTNEGIFKEYEYEIKSDNKPSDFEKVVETLIKDYPYLFEQNA